MSYSKWPSRYRPRARLVATMCVGLAVAGCGQGTTMSDAPTRSVVSGVAGGALINGAECAWITESDGPRIDIAYPVGWTWTVQPLRVVDPRGRLVAQAGDHVSVTGVFAEVGESLCHVGRLFDATAVVAGP